MIKEGTVRYVNRDGELREVAPRDAMYSTALMIATEMFSEGKWQPYGELDEEIKAPEYLHFSNRFTRIV